MNALTPVPNAEAAALSRRLQITAWICLIDHHLAAQHGASAGINARMLLRHFEASGLGQLTSPVGTDGHAVGLTLAGVRGRASHNGALATLRLWRDEAQDTLALL